jgi:hypothetical protein
MNRNLNLLLCEPSRRPGFERSPESINPLPAGRGRISTPFLTKSFKCLEFRVHAANCRISPEPPEGGTPNKDSAKMCPQGGGFFVLT